MSILDTLKRLNTESSDLDTLVELHYQAKGLRAEFELLGVEVPGYVNTALNSIKREIHLKTADAIERQLKEAQARRDSLMTADEKRAKIAAEISALEERKKALTGI